MADNNENKVLNVPHLRFPEFSGEWEMASLQDIAAINPKSDQLQNTFIYIDLEAVEKGELRKIQEIMREEAPSRAQRVIDNNDILFQCVRPYQKNNYIHRILNTSNQQWVASTGYAQIRTTELPNYIYHLLNTDEFNRKVMVRCTGSSYPAINSEDLATIRFYYTPDKKEQFKISRLLDLIDERIATQNKIIEDLKKLKSAIIERHYNQAEKQTVFIADLGEPFNVGNLSKDDLSETGKPCIIYGELFTTYGETISQVESHTNKKEGMTLSKKGDLLFPTSTTVDAISLIAPSFINIDGVILGGDMFGIHINPNYNAQYLSYYFNHIANRQLAKYAKGSTIIHLHYTDIENAKLLLPSLEEQNRMAKCLVSLDAKINIENIFISLLKSQKIYFLYQMFI